MIYLFFGISIIFLTGVIYFKLSWKRYIFLVLLPPFYTSLFLILLKSFEDSDFSNIIVGFIYIYIFSMIIVLPSLIIFAFLVLYLDQKYPMDTIQLAILGSIIGAFSVSFYGKNAMIFALVSGALSILTLKYKFKE